MGIVTQALKCRRYKVLKIAMALRILVGDNGEAQSKLIVLEVPRPATETQ